MSKGCVKFVGPYQRTPGFIFSRPMFEYRER